MQRAVGRGSLQLLLTYECLEFGVPACRPGSCTWGCYTEPWVCPCGMVSVCVRRPQVAHIARTSGMRFNATSDHDVHAEAPKELCTGKTCHHL
jgi:hypothetical protein